MLRPFTWWAILLLMSACASTSISPPAVPPATAIYISPIPPSSSQVYEAELEPGSYIGVGPTVVGFSVPVSIPGAVTTSTPLLASNLDGVKRTGLLSVDLAQLLATVRPEYRRLAATSSSPHFEVTPAVVMDYKPPGYFTFGCFLHTSLIIDGRKRKGARYVVQVSPKFDVNSPKLVENAKNYFVECFGRATELFSLHMSSPDNLFRDALVGPRRVRTKVISQLMPNRVVTFDGLGLWEYRKEDAQVTPVILQ